MKRTLLIAALSALLLISCSKNTVFEETRTFKGNIWNHFTPEVFDINIDNTEDYYNIDFLAAVDTGRYRYDNVPVMIELTSPGGELRQFYGVVALKENNRWRGEMEDGYRVASGRIRSYFSFNSRAPTAWRSATPPASTTWRVCTASRSSSPRPRLTTTCD